MAVESKEDAGIFLVLTTTGHYSLFPLVFTPAGKPQRGGQMSVSQCFKEFLQDPQTKDFP